MTGSSVAILIWFTIGILGVWRITHLLVAEDGPWELLARLRMAAGHGFLGRLLDCFYCLSLWVAAPFAVVIGGGWVERALLWPALSGGAILLERATAKPERPPPATYVEGDTTLEESEDVMLRR